MRRFTTCAVAIALVMALAVPTAAFAAKGGNGNSGGHGKSPVSESASPARPEPPGQSRKAAEASTETSSSSRADQRAARDEYRELMRSERDTRRSQEASGTEKLTGRENAVSRMAGNLERAASKMAEGKRKQMPPGLVSTWMRFMSELGFEVTIDDVPGSAVSTDTVAPDDGVPDELSESDDPEIPEELSLD